MNDFPSIPTRSTLLARLRNWRDEENWKLFVQLYERLIRNLALKSGLTTDEADEVTQETVIEIAVRITTFKYDRKKGSFKAWLYQLTRWRIKDQLRKRQLHLVSLDAVRPGVEQLDSAFAPPHEWEAEWQAVAIKTALGMLKHSLSPKHFQVLQLLVEQQRAVRDVAKIMGMSRNQVYLMKFRGLMRLKSCIRRLERCL